jgi:hypothetical protein
LKGHSFDYRGTESKLNDEAGNDYRGENFLGPSPRNADLKEFMFGLRCYNVQSGPSCCTLQVALSDECGAVLELISRAKSEEPWQKPISSAHLFHHESHTKTQGIEPEAPM